MYAADGDGIAAEVEDELAVAVDAHDVALAALEGTGEDAELDAVAGEGLEGVAQEGDLFGMGLHHIHEGLHDGVADGGGTAVAAVFHQMVLGEILRQEPLQSSHRALQEDESADGGFEGLLDAALLLLVPICITEGLVYEERLFPEIFPVCIICFEPLAESPGRHVLQEEVAPGGGLLGWVAPSYGMFALGCSFYFRSRRSVSPDNVDAVRQALACVGCRR